MIIIIIIIIIIVSASDLASLIRRQEWRKKFLEYEKDRGPLSGARSQECWHTDMIYFDADRFYRLGSKHLFVHARGSPPFSHSSVSHMLLLPSAGS